MKLTVSGFLSNPVKFAAIADTSANVQAGLAQLQTDVADIRSISLTDKHPVFSLAGSDLLANAQALSKINGNYSIALTDATPPILSLTWSQYQADAHVLGNVAATSAYSLIVNAAPASAVGTLVHNSHVSGFYIADNAGHVANNIGSIVKNVGKIGGVAITDTGAHVANALTTLEKAAGSLKGLAITLTDSTTPVLKLTAAEVAQDANVLSAISSPYTIQVTDSAKNVNQYLGALEADIARISAITLTGSAKLAVSAANYAADADALAAINSPYALTVSGVTSAPTESQSPFTMRAPAGMSGQVTLIAYLSVNGAAPVSLGSVAAGAGAAVQFQPQGFSPAAGDKWSLTVTATDAQGHTAAGQIEMTPGYFAGATVTSNYASALSLDFLGVSASGAVSGLPAKYSAADANYYVLEGSATTTVPLSALAAADKGSKVLHQYIQAGKVAVSGIAGTVQADGASQQTSTVTVNGKTVVPDLGHQLDNNQYAIMATVPGVSAGTPVQMWLSDGTGNYLLGTQTLSASQPYIGFSGADLALNGAVLTAGSGATGTAYHLFFTDTSGNGSPGNAVGGLQLALSSPSGGAPSQWVGAPATAGTGVTLEVGSVAQVLAYAAGNPAGTTWYFIEDSIQNIQAAGTALANLAKSQSLVGAYVSGGIAPAGNGYYMNQWPAALAIGSSQQSVRVFGTDTGNWQTHTLIAVPTADNGVSHSLQLYDNGTALGGVQTLVSDGSSTLGVALPAGATLATGNHTLTATLDGKPVSLGFVPAAGGLPAGYAGSLNVWVGSVSQLPAGVSAVTANTLYVVQDTAANLATLGANPLLTAVEQQLLAGGNLAFEVTGGQLSLYQQQLIEQNYLNVLNLSAVRVQDTLLGLDNVPVLGATDSLGVNDNLAHLLYDAAAYENGYPTSGSSGQNNPLIAAFSADRVTLTDSLAVLTNSANQAALQAGFGSGGISSVVVADSVAAFSAGNFAAADQSLQTFAASLDATLHVAVQDSIANLQAALAQNAGQFLTTYGAGVTVQDSAANLEAAYANGSLVALQTAAGSAAFKLTVTDTLANLAGLLNNPAEIGLVAKLQGATVVDSAQNILNAQQSTASGLNPLALAGNVVIQDSYANVLAAAQSDSSLLAHVSQVDLTSGAASGQSPLQIDTGAGGAIPELLLPFMTGRLTATEASDGRGGTLVTITDAASHSVSVDLVGVTDNTGGAYTHGGWYQV